MCAVSCGPLKSVDVAKYQLHGFSDASNQAYSVVIYLRRLVNGLPTVSFVLGKCTVVQRHQSSWPIAKKELVAALNATKLIKQAFDALHLDDCAKYFWCDSRTVLSWIKNTDLRLTKFISRRVDYILLFSNASDWRFCPTNVNAADVGFRPNSILKKESRYLWLNGPEFLRQPKELPTPHYTEFVFIRRADLLNTFNSTEVLRGDLEKLIESPPSLYVLKKRASYPLAFVESKRKFVPPKLNALYFEEALDQIVVLVQKSVYGKFIDRMREKTPEALDDIIKRCSVDALQQEKSRLKEIRALKRYRPCVDKKGALRVEGRLDRSPDISFEAKHPLILSSRHFLTRLVILYYHYRNWHSGIQHTLLSSRQKFWITNGRASVRRYLRECSVCAINKARPIRQLMSDLPPSRTSAYKKHFFTMA